MTAAAFVLAVLSSITYGTADFLGGLGARRAAAIWVVALSQAAGLIFVAAAFPFFPSSFPSSREFFWSVIAGVMGGGGVALLYRALAIGVMSVVAPTTAVCAIAIPVFVGILLGERPTLVATFGIVLAVVAIVLVSLTTSRKSDGTAVGGPKHTPPVALVLAVISGVMIGFFLVALERAGTDTGLWPLLIARVVSTSFFTVAALITRQAGFPDRRALRIIIVSGVIDMLANILYLLAVRQGALSLVATVTSLYPASTVVLARFVLHERLTRTQWLGVACAAAAIVLIVRG